MPLTYAAFGPLKLNRDAKLFFPLALALHAEPTLRLATLDDVRRRCLLQLLLEQVVQPVAPFKLRVRVAFLIRFTAVCHLALTVALVFALLALLCVLAVGGWVVFSSPRGG